MIYYLSDGVAPNFDFLQFGKVRNEKLLNSLFGSLQRETAGQTGDKDDVWKRRREIDNLKDEDEDESVRSPTIFFYLYAY